MVKQRTGSVFFSGLLLAFLMAQGTLFQSISPVSAALTIAPPVQVLSSNVDGLVIELNLPPFQTEINQANGEPCQRIQLAGWGQWGDPGQPAIPFKGEWVGLPPLGEPSLNVVETGSEIVLENFHLCPAATLVPIHDPQALVQESEERLILDEAAYNESASLPGEWAVLGTTTLLRSQRVAPLRLQPFQYQARARRLKYVTHMVVRVNFASQLTLSDSRVDEGPSEAILKSTLLNYPTARSWRVNPVQSSGDLSAAINPSPAVQLAVSQDGIYRVTYADLLTKGVPVGKPGLDPVTFRLLVGGTEVAILVRDGGDGTFDAGDELLFFGQKSGSLYTNTNIYWLTWGGVNGIRIREQDGTPGTALSPTSFSATQRAEKNLSYWSKSPSGADQDRWYWEILTASSASVTKEYAISLPHISAGAPPETTARVRGLLRGYSASPKHHTKIYFNGTLIQDTLWAPQGEFAFEVSVPHTALLENSTFKVEALLGDGITLDYTIVNWFEVEYQHDYTADGGVARFSGDQAGAWKYSIPGFSSAPAEIWNIFQPLTPQRIINSTFAGNTLVFQQDFPTPPHYLAVASGNLLAPDAITMVQSSGLRSTASGADYILITHPDFLAAVQPLATYHRNRGMRVQVVNVQDIYNEFGVGTLDPAAIHDFLAYTYTHWVRPAPSYVLLVGDGNYDFKNYKGTNELNYIPPYLANVDPWMGEAAADNLYVAFDPLNNLPNMALGRLPVKTVAEVTTVVQKILNYPKNSTSIWSQKILVVADIPAAAGNFPAEADAFVRQLPSRFLIDKIYLPVGISTADLNIASQATLNKINAGSMLVHYTGHSSAFFWSIKNLFGKQSIPSLTNQTRLPFILSMTCYLGIYITPSPSGNDLSGFDEMLVRAANGGAIATWSPTGQGTSASHSLLDTGFTQAAFTNHLSEIGLSTTQAKYYLYANSAGKHELVQTYLLFGDPALRLPLDLRITFLPHLQK
jgi:hypothetical protein